MKIADNPVPVDPQMGIDFSRLYFAGTKYPVNYRSFRNSGADQLFTRKAIELRRFIEQHALQNIHFGCVTREDGDGSKKGCKECISLWCDQDFKDSGETEAWPWRPWLKF